MAVKRITVLSKSLSEASLLAFRFFVGRSKRLRENHLFPTSHPSSDSPPSCYVLTVRTYFPTPFSVLGLFILEHPGALPILFFF